MAAKRSSQNLIYLLHYLLIWTENKTAHVHHRNWHVVHQLCISKDPISSDLLWPTEECNLLLYLHEYSRTEICQKLIPIILGATFYEIGTSYNDQNRFNLQPEARYPFYGETPNLFQVEDWIIWQRSDHEMFQNEKEKRKLRYSKTLYFIKNFFDFSSKFSPTWNN